MDHRPGRITTLFIAESAPIGGTFFYYGNGHLGRYLQRSIEEVLAGDGDFLERFKSYGWYLDDLVPAPVDHPDAAQPKSRPPRGGARPATTHRRIPPAGHRVPAEEHRRHRSSRGIQSRLRQPVL
jgi:hypothetical protein